MLWSKKQRTYSAIDIGTTKVITLVCQVSSDGLKILATGYSQSEGMQKGLVIDPNAVKNSIRSSVKQAEFALGRQIPPAYIGVTGAHLYCTNADGAISNNLKIFSESDVDSLLKSTGPSSLPGKQIVQIIPRSFLVDGSERVSDPVGLKGSRLSVESHVVVGDSEPLEVLARAVRSAGVEIKGMVLEHLASAEAVLTKSEKDSGVVLVDIGGGTSDMAVYRNGLLWYTHALPVAGQHFTSDIAAGLGIIPSIAEATKLANGSAITEGVETDASIEVETGLGGHTRSVSQLVLNKLIRDRATELARMIMHKLAETGLKRLPAGGIVLTGGSSALPGLVDIVAEQSKSSVRVGVPSSALGLPGEYERPTYSTSIGLLLWALQKKHAGTFVPAIPISQKMAWHARRIAARLEMEQPEEIKV